METGVIGLDGKPAGLSLLDRRQYLEREGDVLLCSCLVAPLKTYPQVSIRVGLDSLEWPAELGPRFRSPLLSGSVMALSSC